MGMSSQFLGKDMRDLMFMVEPIHWASKWEVTRILGRLSPRPSQRPKELRALPEAERTEGPGASRLAGFRGGVVRGCVFPICALLHVGLEPWEWGTQEVYGWDLVQILVLTLSSCVTLDKSFDLSAKLVTV